MKSRYLLIALVLTLIISSCAPIKRAERLYKGLEFSKAVPVYEKIAASENKHSVKAYERLGDINRLSSHFEQSAAAYKKAIELDGVNPEVYLNFGQVLRSLGKYGEAIEQFDHYLKLNPSDNRATLYADYCRQIINRRNITEFYEIANAKALNTAFSEFSPVIVDDKVIFTSDRSSSTGDRKYGWTGNYYLDLYKAGLPNPAEPEKAVDPAPDLYSNDLNMAFHDGPASFSPDNKTIYFTRVFRKAGEVDTSRYYTNKLKIFTSKYDGNKWLNPEPFYLNSEDYSVGHPAISPDGNTLYFVSDMPGGIGGTDIYTVDLVDGKWSNLKNAGAEINTFGNEMFPFIDQNGTLYFSSDGLPGLGSLDVLKSSFNDGKWAKPENMKEPINSSADDFGFFKGKSGQVLFSSNRLGGQGGDDIYMASLIKYADSVVVTGLVKDRQNGEVLSNATVLLWNQNSDEVLVLKTNSAGEYTATLKPNNNYIFKAVKKGFTTDCLTLKVPEYTRKTTFQNRDLLLVKLKVNEIFRLEKVYYDFDKWNIRPDAAVELNKVADFLNQNPSVNVELGSHTDSRGTDAYNVRLADRRAESAVKYIIEKGIAKSRITAKGYGETQLVNKCKDNVECTEEEHQDNRRTEIKITGLAFDDKSENVEPIEAFKNGQIIKVTDLKKDFFLNCSEEKGL